jgi:glycine/D-amino acid oxidase-like deaminating enzyme
VDLRHTQAGSLAMNPAGFALIGVVATAYGVSAVLVAVIAAHVAVHLLLLTAPSIRGITRRT